MDKLAEKLQADAERIDVQVSDELDRRIDASLRAALPETPRPAAVPRASGFWWASGLTGVAAALIIIAIVNRQSPAVPVPRQTDISPVTTVTTGPIIDWKTESAMLTSPLRQELEDLQSDIKKAEQTVRNDIGL